MKSFDSLKVYFAWKVSFANDHRKSFRILLKCIHFGGSVTFVLSTMWYFVTVEQTTYEYTYNFFYASTSLWLLCWNIIFHMNCSQFMALHRSLGEIRQNGKYSSTQKNNILEMKPQIDMLQNLKGESTKVSMKARTLRLNGCSLTYTRDVFSLFMFYLPLSQRYFDLSYQTLQVNPSNKLIQHREKFDYACRFGYRKMITDNSF